MYNMQNGLHDNNNRRDVNHDIGRETKVSLPSCKQDNCATPPVIISGNRNTEDYHRYGSIQGFTITDKEFSQLSAYIKENYGINLRSEKKTLVTSRLHNVLLQNGFGNFTDYYNYVLADKTGNAASTMVNKITTNHTYFMREAAHYYYFRDKVLPYLTDMVKGKDMRIWSAGCSTGEEPYTLAMIIDDYFGRRKSGWNTEILATDISEQALKAAAQGIYDDENIAPLLPKWRDEYFKRYDDDKSIIIDRIKNEVIFRKFNLMDKVFPFKRKFHVIFCRNVMIYFDMQTKRELINKFYDITEPGGYLFIGLSESVDRKDTRYKYIMPAVYRKE